jgi:hypothetical protein
MKTLRQLSAALILTLALSATASAGKMDCPGVATSSSQATVAGNIPNDVTATGEIQNGVTAADYIPNGVTAAGEIPFNVTFLALLGLILP